MTRAKDGRRFETACRVKGMGLLEKTGENCSADWLKVFRSKDFPPAGSWGLQLDKGQQREGEMAISSRKFLWMCMTGKQRGEIKLVAGAACSSSTSGRAGKLHRRRCGPRWPPTGFVSPHLRPERSRRLHGLSAPHQLHQGRAREGGSRFWVSCFAKE